jgi:hypothetical protein
VESNTRAEQILEQNGDMIEFRMGSLIVHLQTRPQSDQFHDIAQHANTSANLHLHEKRHRQDNVHLYSRTCRWSPNSYTQQAHIIYVHIHIHGRSGGDTKTKETDTCDRCREKRSFEAENNRCRGTCYESPISCNVAVRFSFLCILPGVVCICTPRRK